MTENPQERGLMMFDGLCGFCHGTMRWLAERDQHDRLRFAPQQSTVSEAVLARHGVDREAMLAGNSVYLALDFDTPRERLLTQSDVTVNALLLLGGVWGFWGRILQLIPKPLRDWAYRLFARNRFRFSARYESCPLPSPVVRAKFLA